MVISCGYCLGRINQSLYNLITGMYDRFLDVCYGRSAFNHKPIILMVRREFVVGFCLILILL